MRRGRLSLELHPARVERIILLTRKINKTGAIIYGPLSFASGLLFKLSPWFTVLPLIWFTGMILSQVFLGKCFFNWLNVKLKANRRGWKTKSDLYSTSVTSVVVRVPREAPNQPIILTTED